MEPVIGYKTAQGMDFVVKVLPENLQLISSETLNAPFKISIHDIQGRLFMAKVLPTAGRVCNIPRPSRGAWIVRLNSSEGKVITVP